MFAIGICFRAGFATLAERRPEVFVVRDIGRSACPLEGLWEFHLGDNAAWGAPDFDDSQWEEIAADRPWDHQGHWAYDGFAWYPAFGSVLRRRMTQRQDVAVLIPDVGDATRSIGTAC